MNYRHAYHAGNFADLLKHAALLWLVDRLQANSSEVSVVDTHAGAGFYDLEAGGRRSAEAEAGVAQLMAQAQELPEALTRLAQAVAAANPEGGVRFYPGSPWLVATTLRQVDRLLACELRPEEHERLRPCLKAFSQAQSRNADGFATALASNAAGCRLTLIDPPFERPDDYVQSADTFNRLAGKGGIVAVWTPIKDLETFDGFLRRLDAATTPVDVAELRLRPLTDPMKLNGCAVVTAGAPPGFADAMGPVCSWLAERLGDAGARGEVWRL